MILQKFWWDSLFRVLRNVGYRIRSFFYWVRSVVFFNFARLVALLQWHRQQWSYEVLRPKIGIQLGNHFDWNFRFFSFSLRCWWIIWFFFLRSKFSENFQFLLPRCCYVVFVHLRRHFVFGINGFYTAFCSRSLWISSPICMRKTIIIAHFLTCNNERIKKNGQLIFVFNCLKKCPFGENFDNRQCFQFSDVPLRPCKIKAVYEIGVGGT